MKGLPAARGALCRLASERRQRRSKSGAPSLSLEPTSSRVQRVRHGGWRLSILGSGAIEQTQPVLRRGIDRQVARSVEPIRPDILNQRSQVPATIAAINHGVDQANARDDARKPISRGSTRLIGYTPGVRLAIASKTRVVAQIERSHGQRLPRDRGPGQVPATPLRR